MHCSQNNFNYQQVRSSEYINCFKGFLYQAEENKHLLVCAPQL